MSKHTLSVGSVDITGTYGVYIDTSLSYNKPERRASSISIPGRSGNLILDETTTQNEVVFNNVIITYPAYIRGNFQTTWDALINALAKVNGYAKISCSADPTHFRLGRVIIPQTPRVKHIGENGFFDLSFDCKPQRFLNSGDDYVAVTSSITNPTNFDSNPLIKVTGNGTLYFQNGQVTVTVANPSTAPTVITYIDCESMTCYDNYQVSMNKYVTFDKPYFPALYSGSNHISITAGSPSISIKPRWWEI